MHSRRDFLRNAAALTGSAFVWGAIPEAIANAAKIDPEEDTTFLDAEHIVVLMQENRSFDHCYGSLRGVRGFRDPRPHRQPNGRPVWFQADAKGDVYTPFRLDMKGSNSTWIGGLPHSWTDQVDARNGGAYDKWLIAKARKDLPLTMGCYTREDLPFYYALADAFTVCDQAFCSSLTGTTPNRLYLWTGTIREDANDPARVVNGDTDYDAEAAWKTFPERLQDAGVSWRIYQNEISLGSGFTGTEDAWLANFTDNPIEWFTQYRVRFSKSRREYVARRIEALPAEIDAKSKAPSAETPDQKTKREKELASLQLQHEDLRRESAMYTEDAWNALSKRDKALHENAFATNAIDPNWRTLEPLTYEEDGQKRTLDVPKGDTLAQFRADVDQGKLPAISWIVAPEAFSDHPGSAWFGAWYVSEVMNILTKNPEVWKKTIFILCYDENDGYFDHVPPFVAPHPGRPETGKTSTGLDTAVDVANNHGRDHSIGLGYRCPLVVASPWSRGGCVNSQVFDHTSILQLMEVWLAGKRKKVVESNISDWRRTVCGDMTSIFRPYRGEKMELPKPLDRDRTIVDIHKARFKSPMKGVTPLPASEIERTEVRHAQEPGTRPSCPLPYEFEVNAFLEGGRLKVRMEARNRRFGEKSAGGAFNLLSYGRTFSSRAYAVRPGSEVTDAFPSSAGYDIRIEGPNGFVREFRGNGESTLRVTVQSKGQGLEVALENDSANEIEVTLSDASYGARTQKKKIGPKGLAKMIWSAKDTQGWYDLSVESPGVAYRYAGRVETGKWTISDPAMA